MHPAYILLEENLATALHIFSALALRVYRVCSVVVVRELNTDIGSRAHFERTVPLPHSEPVSLGAKVK
jgi:hypothetical protein